jgi:hypothetical protein
MLSSMRAGLEIQGSEVKAGTEEPSSNDGMTSEDAAAYVRSLRHENSRRRKRLTKGCFEVKRKA